MKIKKKMFRSILTKYNLRSLPIQFRSLKCSSSGIRFNKFDDPSNDYKVIYQRSNEVEENYGPFRSKMNFDRAQLDQKFNYKNEENDLDDLDDMEALVKLRNEYKNKKFDTINVDKELLNDELILKVNNCDNISNLLTIIQDEIDQLTPKQLEFIFIRFNELCSISRQNKDDPENGYKEVIRITSVSSVFDRLLHRPFKISEDLNASILPVMLRTFQNFNVDPGSKIVRQTLNRIYSKMSSLKFEELVQCLTVLHLLSKDELATKKFNSLFHILLDEVKLMINNTDLKNQSPEIIVQFIYLLNVLPARSFKDNESQFDLINSLFNQLNPTYLKLEFKSAVRLLKSFKLFNILCNKKNRSSKLTPKTRFPALYSKIVERCNTIIYEELSIEGSNEKFDFLLKFLHKNLDPSFFEFPTFYEYKLLSLLSYHLENEGLNRKNEQNAVNLVRNYSKSDIYDEKLMKLIYGHAFTDDKFLRRTNRLVFFRIFNRIEFPFLDLQSLVSRIFNYPKKYEEDIMYKKGSSSNLLTVLTSLIINDIHHDELYKFICNQLDRQDRSEYRYLKSKVLVDNCFLANAYLENFSTLQPDLKKTLSYKMKMVLNNLRSTNKLTKIDYSYFKVNNRLQHDAYLSNGIYVYLFGIYDKSTGDLVSLKDYTELFSKIDKIPLTENQQLVAFVEYQILKGNIGNYEQLNKKALKKILNDFNIKVLKVNLRRFIIFRNKITNFILRFLQFNFDEIIGRPIGMNAQHFEQAILDSYK